MDIATLIGIILGFSALIIGFILEGGHISALFLLPPAIIVFGGTFGAVIASFPIKEIRKIPQWLKIAFTEQNYDVLENYERLVRFAEKARREGLLSLEQEMDEVEDDFIREGMQLVIDGTDPDITREILESNIAVMEKRHKVGIDVFEAAGGYSPTLGIIGTVMGLVHVLGNLSDPDQLSKSIAGAFLATLYGVCFANLLYLPIATKLKQKDQMEIAAREMVMDGILSIQAGENPSILREKLKTHLGNMPIPVSPRQE